MIDMLQGAAWAAYHDRVATSERAQGNPDGADFYQRLANRARHSLSQLRGCESRGGRARSSLARPVRILSLAPSAGGDLFAASGLVDQRAGYRDADGLGGGAEGVPVHADGGTL
jgi:hypothetical protein